MPIELVPGWTLARDDVPRSVVREVCALIGSLTDLTLSRALQALDETHQPGQSNNAWVKAARRVVRARGWARAEYCNDSPGQRRARSQRRWDKASMRPIRR